MAEIVVQLFMETLSSLNVEEGTVLLGEIGRDVNEIKDDLETMRAFLQDADSRGETDQGVKTSVKQVRDVAYDTQAVLYEILLRLVRPHTNGIFDSLLHKLHDVKHLETRHRLVAEVLNIKARYLESLSRILLLSYNNLPYYLKPCFMYLSMFPADYFIRQMTLIQMWIAEGFIEEKPGVTMEAVAGDYINELINRSMIQIVELTKCNEVKSCRIHDLVRETILSKSNEECFSTTIITGSQEGMGYLNEKARRISIYYNSTGENNYNYSMVSRCSNIRTLMVFQLDKPPRSFQMTLFNAFRLLRVLDLEGAYLVAFPPELVELIHLRYLSLRGTKILELPMSVGKLKNLETLDLKNAGVSDLPVEILKLHRLRHLLVNCFCIIGDTSIVHRLGVTVPTGRIGNLTCLQTLSYLDVQHQDACDSGILLKELGMLTQLRRLGIMNLRSQDGRDLCLALEKMTHLHSLEIQRSITTTTTTTDVNKEFLELESFISPPQLLRRLCLDGRLRRLPVWIANSLVNLIALGLRFSRLPCEEGDPLKAFQHMPNLMYLNLLEAYDGEELCCSEAGGYQNLKRLMVSKMEGLKRMRFMKGSMPMLRELEIWDCPAFEMVPLGIEHLSGLQELKLYGVQPELVKRIRKVQGEAQGGEDCWKVQHISTIKHFYRDTQGSLVTENL